MGNSAYANDIRAASVTIDAAQIQGKLVDSFSTANSLKQDWTHSIHTSGKHTTLTHEIAGQNVQTQIKAKLVSPKDSETYQICVASFANMLL